MEDKEENYWKTQIENYYKRKEEPKLKYKSWQPARWAGNLSAATLIKEFITKLNSILEVGAGSAAFSFQLKELYQNANLNAIDLSPVAKKYALTIAKDLGEEINYVEGNLFEADKSLKSDIVLSLGVIEHYNKEMQYAFIEKCKELSNKYVLIAIPNQESAIFKSYVSWSNKNNNHYEEEHEPLTIDELEQMMKEKGIEILIKDGFQVYLSESSFLEATLKENEKYIEKLKNNLLKYDAEIGNIFPNYNFKCEDIKNMAAAELELTKEDRKELSFMTFILGKLG